MRLLLNVRKFRCPQKVCPRKIFTERLPSVVESYARNIEVIARDRYRPYIEGASAGAPDAVQVADRFHVLKNLYDAVERAVKRNRHALREPDDASEEREEGPAPEPTQEAGHPGWGHRADPKQREERLKSYERVVELRERGLYVEDIAGQVGLSRSTVTSWLNAGGFPERKRPKKMKPSPVAPYADYLERRWKERCINMSRLWREI